MTQNSSKVVGRFYRWLLM